MTNRERFLSAMLVFVGATLSCKPSKKASVLNNDGSTNDEYSSAILKNFPTETNVLFRYLNDDIPNSYKNNPCRYGTFDGDRKGHDCLSNFYFSFLLPKALPREFVTTDVAIPRRRPVVEASGESTTSYEVWRSIKINNRLVIFKMEDFFKANNANGDWSTANIANISKYNKPDGNASEHSWWGVKYVCPATLLEKASLEEKVKYCLDIRRYEPAEIASQNSLVDSSEFVIGRKQKRWAFRAWSNP